MNSNSDKMWGPLVFLMLVAIIGFAWYALTHKVSLEGIAIILGLLISKLGTLIDFRYGSSKGSKDKTDALVKEADSRNSGQSVAAILLLCGILLLGSCRAAKVVSDQQTTVAMAKDEKQEKKRDSSATNIKTSSVEQSGYNSVSTDTAVGISGNNIGLVLDNLHTDADTFIKKGNLTFHAYTDNKGARHLDCKEDSVTLVLRNFMMEEVYHNYRFDSLGTYYRHVMDSVATRDSVAHLERHTVVKEKREGWMAVAFGYVRNCFAVFGLLCLIVLLIRHIIKSHT